MMFTTLADRIIHLGVAVSVTALAVCCEQLKSAIGKRDARMMR